MINDKPLEKPLDKKNLDKAINTINHAMEVQKKLTTKYYELRNALMRQSRAISDFWLDEKEWKKQSHKEKLEIMKNETCVHYQSSGSIYQDMKEFPFFAKKQWLLDRKRLINEGKYNE